MNTKYKFDRNEVKCWKNVIEISHKKAEEHTRQHLDYKKTVLAKHTIRYTIVISKCIPYERMITYGKSSLVKCRMGDYEYPLEIS